MRALVATMLFGACFSCVTRARALDYEYEAADGCPDREAFIDETARRLKHPVEQSSVERLTVSVVKKGDYEATLVLFERGFEPVSRTVHAQDCQQAVNAIALAAALALDERYEENETPPSEPREPTAPVQNAPEVTPEPSQPKEPQPPAPQPPEPQPPAPAPVPPHAAPPHPAATTLARSTAAPQPPAEVSSEPLPWVVGVRAAAFVATGYSPKPSVGPSLEAGLERGQLAAFLEASYGFEHRVRRNGQTADFSVYGLRVLPCYLLSVTPGGSVLRTCAVIEYSRVLAAGVQKSDVLTVFPRSNTPFWALGAAAGLLAPLGAGWSAEVDLGVHAPLVRSRFRFVNSNGKLHEYPAVAGRLSVGLGLSW